MTRVKRGTTSLKRRRRILKKTKGFRWQRSKKERAAREALLHAYTHSFHDRRKKKRVMRALWNVKINAASRLSNTSYSKLIGNLKKANIKLDRKILSALAADNPSVFEAIVKEAG
ncbi:MAG: 50S ribosomal protein L20 [Candidatus Ryanbacteria bacterium]|nr:50S ribosomal protein L20 [Candidatus Ryanbacteria bacterium]